MFFSESVLCPTEEARELRVAHQALQKVVRHRSERVVAAEALVKRWHSSGCRHSAGRRGLSACVAGGRDGKQAYSHGGCELQGPSSGLVDNASPIRSGLTFECMPESLQTN